MLTVEMISTGDEVLHGQIVDTNAAWLADYFFQQGMPLMRRHTVGDNLDSLIRIILERSGQADIVIVNGGLGPTSDDLSALAAARAVGEELVLHEPWLKHMMRFFENRGRRMALTNRKQAMIPASGEILNNAVGTACGFAMKLNRCLFFFTPGVPSEFRVMVEKEIFPRLCTRFSLPAPPICLRLTTFGRSESELAQRLDPLALPEGVVMGYRSSMPTIELKLTGPADRHAEMAGLWQDVRKVAGNSLIFEGLAGLPAMLAEKLHERQLHVTVSEQFSGGMLALEMNRAGAPLLNAEVLLPQQESLADIAVRARERSQAFRGAIAVVSGAWLEEGILFALACELGCKAVRVQLDVSQHTLSVRQAVVSLIAQNMLRRLLNDEDVTLGHGWVHVTERIAL